MSIRRKARTQFCFRLYSNAMDPRQNEITAPKLIGALRRYRLLPAIVFMQTRRRCDEAAIDVAHDLSQPLDTARVDARREFFEQSITSLPEIAAHRHAKVLVNAGVASHHAGHLPAWKLTVEKMMSAGLLDAIFATSTVAAGVDFPARTVVIGNADTRGNDGWRPLTVNELRQMTGRAGRRGRDNVGFAVLVPGQFQDPRRISELLRSEPEPIVSRFKATYTSLLNLLDAFEDLEQVREITEKSFAFRRKFKRPGGRDRLAREIWEPFERRARVLDHLGYIELEAERVTPDGKWLADLRIDRPLIVGEALRRGSLVEIEPARFAGVIAAIAADPERSYGELRTTAALDDRLSEIEDLIYSVGNVELRFGVQPVEELNLSAAAAAERWASGMDWSELAKRSRAEEGDLIRLMSRTGEALRQISDLKEDAAYSALARSAARAVLREPVR